MLDFRKILRTYLMDDPWEFSEHFHSKEVIHLVSTQKFPINYYLLPLDTHT